jgi:hypothetical protein
LGRGFFAQGLALDGQHQLKLWGEINLARSARGASRLICHRFHSQVADFSEGTHDNLQAKEIVKK